MLLLIFSCLLQSQVFKDNCPSAPLEKVLQIACEVQPTQKSVHTKKEINDYLQTYWLRQPGTERNTLIPPVKIRPKQIKDFYNAFCGLEMLGNHRIRKMPNPVAVVILGGSYSSMKERIVLAKKLVKSRTKKPHVILLTGDRNLEKIRTDTAKPLDDGAPEICNTEGDAGKYLAGTTPDCPMKVLNSPKKPDALRATTADNATTLKEWFLENNIQGRIFLVSTQPYGQYQLATFLKCFSDKNYSFSVFAIPLHDPFDDTMVAKCMDTLARWVYIETTQS